MVKVSSCPKLLVGLVRFVEFNVGQLYIYIKSGVVYVLCNTNLDCVDDAH